MPNKTIKNTFNAGELTPNLDGRTDISKYYNGCSKLVNGIVMPQGGVTKRTGTEFVAKAKGACRLIPFEFSSDDAMVIELSNLAARFYKDGERIMEDAKNIGVSKTITKFADYGGTVAGTVKCKTSASHGFVTGNHITIAGTTNYNGTYSITYIDADEFYFTATWVSDDATGTATVGVSLPSAAVVKVFSTSHGYSTGDIVRFYGLTGADELEYSKSTNPVEYTITYVDANSFTLNGTDGDDFTAYTTGGTVKRVYTLTTPFATADLFDLHYIQSADVIYFSHNDYEPQKLSRVSDNSWTIADLAVTGGPFLEENTDTVKTMKFTETRYSGTQTAADDGSTPDVLTDSTKTFTANALTGWIIYNTTDASKGTVISNTTNTVTATLAGGIDNSWDLNDTYVILSPYETGFYHKAGDTGTLEADGTGNTPFLSTHVGSLWSLKKYRIGDNYVSRTGTGADGTTSPILIKGDFSLDCVGFSTSATTTVSLQRKQGDGDWQEYRKFTSASAFSGSEDEDNVYYRVVISGAQATTNVTLVAKKQTVIGTVKITAVTDSDTATAEVVDNVFKDVVADTSITSLEDGHAANLPIFVGKTAHGLSAGQIVIFKGITNSSFSYLNYNATTNNYYVVATKGTDDFYLCGTGGGGGNNTSQTTGVGEYYAIRDYTQTSEWAEGAWSEYRGYPKTLCFYEDRLCFGGSISNPQTIWTSKSSDYTNFATGVLDDDAIVVTINDADVSQIQWMYADDLLIAGTSKKEYRVSASNTDDPISPSDIKIKPTSAHGSTGLQAVYLNSAIFYAQRQGRKLRAMRFSDTTARYESDDATVLSNHILENSPLQFGIQRIPDAALWVILDNGELASFSYEPAQEVLAWGRHVTGSILSTPYDLFKSVAVIAGDVEDEIWVCVYRVIDGTGQYFIERFMPRLYDQLDDALFLDCATIASPSPTTYPSVNILLASDTVRCGSGECNSSLCGGVPS